MNRLQKKCVIAMAGIHLLLLTILIVGPAFFNPQPKTDNTQVLDVIPANLIDAAMNSGVRNATPPPPTPIVSQPQPPQPQEQTPPPKPEPVPAPSLMTRVEKFFESPKPPPKPAENQPHKIQPNLKLVTQATPNNVANPRDAKAIASAIKNLKNNLKSGTLVDAPGNSSVAYASYKDALATIYYNAWITPNSADKDAPATVVKIVVAADGTIISSRIITPSGDANIDASVQRVLDRVTSVPPLPDGSKAQQEFMMSFNLKTKEMLE